MSDDKAKDAKETAQPRRNIEFVIEIGDRLNGTHQWPPTKKFLRGAWKLENTRNMDLDPEGQFAIMRQMRDIPGMCIHVSTQRKTARIFDPLAEPSNKDLLANITATYERAWGKKCGPDKPTVVDDMNADEIKTWLYWCRRYVDNRCCSIRQGDVPAVQEIFAMPGTIIREDNEDKMTNEERYRPMTHATELVR